MITRTIKMGWPIQKKKKDEIITLVSTSHTSRAYVPYPQSSIALACVGAGLRS